MSEKKPNYNKSGRYSPDSSISHENKSQEERWGELEHKGEDWTNDQLCDLMEGFLVKEFPWKGDDSMCTELGRTYKSVETQLQKMGFRYGYKESNFIPRNPYLREGRKPSVRAVWIIQLATGEKWRTTKRAHEVEYLSRVLLQPEGEVDELLTNLTAAKEMGFNIEEFLAKDIQELSELERATRIERNLWNWKSGWEKGGIFRFIDAGLVLRKKSNRSKHHEYH